MIFNRRKLLGLFGAAPFVVAGLEATSVEAVEKTAAALAPRAGSTIVNGGSGYGLYSVYPGGFRVEQA